MNLTCPKCGKEHQETIVDCSRCGYTMNRNLPLVSGVSKTIYVGEEKQKSLSCVECGYPLREDADACPNCSMSISSGNNSNDSPTKERIADVTQQLSSENNDLNHKHSFEDDSKKLGTISDSPSVEQKTVVQSEAKTIVQINASPSDNSEMTNTVQETVLQPQFGNSDYIGATPNGPKTVLDPVLTAPDNLASSNVVLKFTSVSLDGEGGCPDINVTEKQTTIGREDIDSRDGSISKNHLSVYEEKGKWYVENQASNQATFMVVNGKQEINDGDLILLGNSKFFKIEIMK